MTRGPFALPRNRCRHQHLVREWAIDGSTTVKALQHCDTCSAARVLRDGKWSKWRRLPIPGRPDGPGVIIRGPFQGLIG